MNDVIKKKQTLKEIFLNACEKYSKKDFKESRSLCYKILSIDSNYFDALGLLSNISLANRDFKVFGTNMTTTLCEFNTNNPGILIKTAGADQDQAIIAPHTSSHSIETSWTNTKWGTENQLEWECAINIPVVTDVKVWAGINLSSEQLLESNNDKLFFKFQTDSTNSETFTDFTKLHFIHSIAGTHYVSELPITVEADTVIGNSDT